jgi:hypothetical protein
MRTQIAEPHIRDRRHHLNERRTAHRTRVRAGDVCGPDGNSLPDVIADQ